MRADVKLSHRLTYGRILVPARGLALIPNGVDLLVQGAGHLANSIVVSYLLGRWASLLRQIRLHVQLRNGRAFARPRLSHNTVHLRTLWSAWRQISFVLHDFGEHLVGRALRPCFEVLIDVLFAVLAHR